MSSTFPQEVIFEILLRLPVKSVLKFRCVSKSWLLLLSTPLFCKTHVKFSLNNPKMTCYRLVVASLSRVARNCNIYNIESENSSLTVSKPNFLPISLPLSCILGSCNGLICLASYSFTLMIWNPCTGKSNVFPDSMHKGDCYIKYGFGYDASLDDYKVVKIFSFYNQTEGRYENMVKVYSLKDKSWKTIQGFNSGYINANLAIFANGVLHWEACWGDSWEIVTLDLATERYGKIVLPSYEKGGGTYWTLGASRGYLVGCCNYERNKTDVWMRKEYAVEKSWTKLVTISSPDDHRGFILPLFVAENGNEVLLKINAELMLYNSRDGSFKRLDGYSPGDFWRVQVGTYFESLASPHI